MEVCEKSDLALANTLTMTCPVCLSDQADAPGVTGYMDGRLESTVIMVCDDCESVYLSPAPDTKKLTERSETVARVTESLIERVVASMDASRTLACGYTDDRLAAAEANGESYDVILLSHCLESSHDVRELMRRAAGRLNPGGVVEVIIANTRSSCLGVFGGRHWYAFDYPRARQFVSLKGLSVLAEQAGMRVVSHRTKMAVSSWLTSTRNWLSDWGYSSLLRSLIAGAWGGPWLLCAFLEYLAGLRGRGAVLVARLERLP